MNYFLPRRKGGRASALTEIYKLTLSGSLAAEAGPFARPLKILRIKGTHCLGHKRSGSEKKAPDGLFTAYI